ncbi:hypothetical protein [Kribbella sp. NPDC055071]
MADRDVDAAEREPRTGKPAAIRDAGSDYGVPGQVVDLGSKAGNDAIERSGYSAHPAGITPGTEVRGTPRERAAQIAESDDTALINQLDEATIAAANQEQRLRMIRALNDHGGLLERFMLVPLWDSFGASLREVAEGHPGDWQTSFQVAPGAMRQGRNVSGVRHVFYQDVEDLARRYLDLNEQFCRHEFEHLGLSPDGDVTTGPPTAEQDRERQDLRNNATQLAADQEALAALRRIPVGYEMVPTSIDGDMPVRGAQVTFDPAAPPMTGADAGDAGTRPWAEVKKQYDRMSLLIRVRTMANPALFPMVAGHPEDPAAAKTVSTGSDADALRTAGDGLKGVLANIAKTRPLLGTLAPDLEPLQAQLIAGSQVVTPDRNWNSSGFYSAIAGDLAAQHRPGVWWAELAKSIGIATAEAAAYVVAGLATGGTAIALGLGGKAAVDLALAKGKADVMRAAYGATTSEETALLTDGQVNQAEAAVIETAVFGLLDVLAAGSGVRSALRGIMQFEQVATERAAKAAAAAERLIAKQTVKDAAQDAAQDAAKAAAAAELPTVKADADAAAKAASDAEVAAKTAPPEESARAHAAAVKVRADADRAQEAVDKVAAIAEGRYGTVSSTPLVDPTGLASQASLDATVAAARREFSLTWTSLTVAQKRQRLLDLFNDRLKRDGLPPLKGLKFKSGADGLFDAKTWEVHIGIQLMAPDQSMEGVVSLMYHEAAHAQDYFRMAQLELGRGKFPPQIRAELGIEADAVAAAMAEGPMTPGHPYYDSTEEIFSSVYGAKRQLRINTLDLWHIAEDELKKAVQRLDTVWDKATGMPRPGVSPSEYELVVKIWKSSVTERDVAEANYRKLAEEVRAYGVQEALLRTFDSSFEVADTLKMIIATSGKTGLSATTLAGLYELQRRLNQDPKGS